MLFSGMKAVIFLIATCLVSAIFPLESSFAAAKKSPSKSAAQKKKAKGKSEKSGGATSVPASGKAKSSGSRIEVLANLGLSPSPLLGFGGTFGMIKDDGGGLETTLTIASGKSGTISASVTHIGARYRIGLIKVGYIGAGAGFRMASGKWFVLNADESAEYEAGSSLNAVTIDGAAGAQFKFGSIIIGADIVGISFPIFKMGVKKTVPSESDYSETDANAQQGKFDKLAAGMSLTLAKVGVGMMF